MFFHRMLCVLVLTVLIFIVFLCKKYGNNTLPKEGVMIQLNVFNIFFRALISSREKKHASMCPYWGDEVLWNDNQTVLVGDTTGSCAMCAIEKSRCPVMNYDLSRIHLETFAEDCEYITARERIRRLLKSCFVSLHPLQFLILLEKRKEELQHVTQYVNDEGGLIACDRCVFVTKSTGTVQVLDALGCEVSAIINRVPDGTVDVSVAAFYNWDEPSEAWVTRQNALDYIPKRPIYSAVVGF